MELSSEHLTAGVVPLTCFLCAQQILALRLIRIDGGDRHIIGCVNLQILQDVGGLIIVQNFLMWKTKHSSWEGQNRCNNKYPSNWFKSLHFPCSLCLRWPFRCAKAVSVGIIKEYLHKWFLLTYWKLFSPFLLQPMRYRATSGAPWSQVALKLVWVTSENCKFLGAGTTSTEQRKGRSVWSLSQCSMVSFS